MKNAKIFLIGKGQEQLIPMTETEYPQEDKLQELLAHYPDLLPGDQINPDEPLRWLLVGREIGVPGDVEEGDRWSLDHLFLDQNGVPTFVECKRSSDTRGRREVVAQMLDYAANGTEYWSMARLREYAAQTATKQGRTIEDQIAQLIGPSDDPDEAVESFWTTVEDNLHAGHVRLIFVADETPKELRRLVEFLNEKMAGVEVLAVEVKQFLSDNHQVLVPRVIGLTEAARERKGTVARRSGHTNRQEFLSKLTEVEVTGFFERALDLADKNGFIVYWGEKGFSLRTKLAKADRTVTFAYGWTTPDFNFYFDLPISEAETIALRNELINFGIFEKSGEKTLRAHVNKETISSLNQALDLMLKRVKKISADY